MKDDLGAEGKVSRAFIERHLDRHYLWLADANLIGIAVMSTIAMCLAPRIALPENVFLGRLMGAACLAMGGIYLLIRRSKANAPARVFMVLTQMLTVWAQCRFVAAQIERHRDDLTAPPATLVFSIAVFMALSTPLRRVGAALACLGHVALIVWACHGDFAGYYRFTLIVAITICLAFAMHRFIAQEAAYRAEQEILAALRMAPMDVVRSSMNAPRDELEATLKPRPRLCVCLASDWRGYQQLSREVKPEALVAALETYYDAAREHLHKCLPHGRFYSDWSADELLVVLPVDDPDGLPAATAEMIAFARELIRMKARFARAVELPLQIDVGVAAGECIVGLSGPPRFRKVTAVGAVPVLAHYLQGYGKTLRAQHGDADRLIYAASAAGSELPPDAMAAAGVQLHPALPHVTIVYETPLRGRSGRMAGTGPASRGDGDAQSA